MITVVIKEPEKEAYSKEISKAIKRLNNYSI